MQTMTITPQLENGRYYIDLPEQLKDTEFTLQIVLKKEKAKQESPREKLEKVQSFAGIASGSDIQIDESEWYQQ
ncbi:MAG: hypothetical protein B6D64_15225 [Bacteroidetes bacterium 4484_276]|nr:MAG: hypothetical protein B6D64_15225 [Bacteroidetes bacterium 4484_276]